MTQKLNLSELLKEKSNSTSTGYLAITKDSVSWKVYLQAGELEYVDCSVQSVAQLQYYLFRQGYKKAISALKDIPADWIKLQSYDADNSSEPTFYQQVIQWLITKQHIDSSAIAKLLKAITQDCLESCLWLNEANHTWQETESLSNWIANNTKPLNLVNLLDNLNNRVQKWQNCTTKLLSPYQRPYFAYGWNLKELPATGKLSALVLKELAGIVNGRSSIYQLALLLNKNEIRVAQTLSPYIEAEIIKLRNPQPPLDKLPNIPPVKVQTEAAESEFFPVVEKAAIKPEKTTKKYKIVCIDDSQTILAEMVRFLAHDLFEIITVDDPVQASSLIFRLKPDMILLDITMPRINGYKLCGLLRSSNMFNDTPIIMVTGNTGIIDKARAKLAGATDYLAKPFTQSSLVTMVSKYADKQNKPVMSS